MEDKKPQYYYIATLEITSPLDIQHLREQIIKDIDSVNFRELFLITKEDHYDGAPEYIDPYQPTLIKHANDILKGEKGIEKFHYSIDKKSR